MLPSTSIVNADVTLVAGKECLISHHWAALPCCGVLRASTQAFTASHILIGEETTSLHNVELSCQRHSGMDGVVCVYCTYLKTRAEHRFYVRKYNEAHHLNRCAASWEMA